MKIVIKGKDEVIAVKLMFYAIASIEVKELSVADTLFVQEARKICLNFIIKGETNQLKLTVMMLLMIDYYYDFLCENLPAFEKNVLLKIMSEMQKQTTNAVINQNLLYNGKF